MAKRQPFDTNLSFPPAPTRALISTPLDGIIGGPVPRPEAPPPEAAREAIEAETPSRVETPPAPAVVETAASRAVSAEPLPQPAATPAVQPADTILGDVATTVARVDPTDDGKVTVKLPPDLKNRLYNAIYAERGTVGDYLTRAVDDLMDQLERERGGPYPQRPPADVKFRAGRRPR